MYEIGVGVEVDYVIEHNSATYFLVNMIRLGEGDREYVEEAEGWLRRGKEIDRQSKEWREFVERSIEMLVSRVQYPRTQDK